MMLRDGRLCWRDFSLRNAADLDANGGRADALCRLIEDAVNRAERCGGLAAAVASRSSPPCGRADAYAVPSPLRSACEETPSAWKLCLVFASIWKEALDAQLLECNVLRRAERCDRREQIERGFPLSKCMARTGAPDVWAEAPAMVSRTSG